MRVIIIGAGGAGAMAAWRLAASGHAVTVLEQFRLDHDRGSSYGDSRIVRRVYPDALYTGLMAEAYRLWETLQQDSGQRGLFVPSGGIYCGPETHSLMLSARESLAASGVAHEILIPQECVRRFPAFRLSPEEIALFEPSMGYARASECVRAAAGLAMRHGAAILEANPVRSIVPTDSGVRVTAASGEMFEADRLLLTAGAWTNNLLEPFGVRLPLTVTRQPYVHLKPKRGLDIWEPGRFPVWIDAGANTYGFPHLGGIPGVKIGIHHHGAAVTPDTADRTVQEADREAIRAYARVRFPDLSEETVYEKVCLYTNTPDEDFIIDTVPGLPQIAFVSACSGHGFKFTPLLGQIAAGLLTGSPMLYDLSRFRLARFAPHGTIR